ncbi:MAG: hypothetical protein JW982_04910 [Spirochaetes bacterium]|nr:hypothetical protein [Spirochaetota bacterium]
MLKKWIDCFKNKNFRIQWIITFLFSVPVTVLLPLVLAFVEKRNGVRLADPVLEILVPVDLSVFIFILLYSLSILGIIHLLHHPCSALLTAQSYLVVLSLRMLCMFLAPLEPPAGIVPLHDFFLEHTFYSGNVNLKDLFFSGHTAIIFLFFVTIENRRLKMVFLAGTSCIGAALMLQHAHYTIDILTAIAASYLSVAVVRNISGKFSGIYCKEC